MKTANRNYESETRLLKTPQHWPHKPTGRFPWVICDETRLRLVAKRLSISVGLRRRHLDVFPGQRPHHAKSEKQGIRMEPAALGELWVLNFPLNIALLENDSTYNEPAARPCLCTPGQKRLRYNLIPEMRLHLGD